MNLLADESVDAQVVQRLRAEGHGVGYVAELSPSITDNEVLARANADQCLLMTVDKDFGELIFRQRRVAQGGVLIRLSGLSSLLKAQRHSAARQRNAARVYCHFSRHGAHPS